MGVGFVPRVLVVCALAAHGGARGEEGAAPGVVATATSTATATPTATSTATSTSTPTPTATSTPTANSTGAPAARRTSTSTGAPVSMSVAGVPAARGSKEPPPAVIMVPLVGAVMLPLSLPTSVPHARQQAGAKETKP